LDNRFYVLILGVLGVWRLTHLLNAEDGPGKALARFRNLVGAGFWGELLDCFYCLSLWVAAPFAFFLGNPWSEKLLLWLALSAAAILLERATAKVSAVGEPIVYHEDPPPAKEENHELLWPGEKSSRN
jgi:hypothetical protein